MDVNPAGVALIVVAVVCVIVGIRGTQGSVFKALTGHDSTKAVSGNWSVGGPVTGGGTNTLPNANGGWTVGGPVQNGTVGATVPRFVA
jgi:hypothetical protein